jgi:hypothetical protein
MQSSLKHATNQPSITTRARAYLLRFTSGLSVEKLDELVKGDITLLLIIHVQELLERPLHLRETNLAIGG